MRSSKKEPGQLFDSTAKIESPQRLFREFCDYQKCFREIHAIEGTSLYSIFYCVVEISAVMLEPTTRVLGRVDVRTGADLVDPFGIFHFALAAGW